MDKKKYQNGQICYVELCTQDLNKSKTFYSTTFDWQAKMLDFGFEYLRFYQNEQCIAGCYEADKNDKDEMKNIWNLYLAVDNINTTIFRLKQEGVKFLSAASNFLKEGKVAAFEDLAGNQICLWQGRNFLGQDIISENGAFAGAILQHPEPLKMAMFYAKHFGWQLNQVSEEKITAQVDGWELAHFIKGAESKPWVPIFGQNLATYGLEEDNIGATFGRTQE